MIVKTCEIRLLGWNVICVALILELLFFTAQIDDPAPRLEFAPVI